MITLIFILYVLPMIWCFYGAYQHYKKNSDSELIAIQICIGLIPITNLAIGLYNFLVFIIDKIKEK